MNRLLRPFQQREFLGMALGILLVSIAIATAIVSSFTLRTIQDQVERRHITRAVLVALLSQMQDAETGQLRYVVTGDEEYLEPYRRAVTDHELYLQELERLTAARSEQRQRVAELRELIAQHLEVLEQGIEERQQGDPRGAAQAVLSGRGPAVMVQIREKIAAADAASVEMLEEREAAEMVQWRWLLVSATLGWGLGSVLVVRAMMLAERSRRAAERAQRQFRGLFESAPGSYLVLEPDEYRIVAVSDSYLRATNTDRARILGRSVFEIFPDDPANTGVTGMQNLERSLDHVRATRRADVMAIQRYPIPRPNAEGGGFEDRWWTPLNSPVLGPRGELIYIIHRVEDVTAIMQSLEDAGETRLGPLEAQTQHLLSEIMLRGKELQQANEELLRSERELQIANRELTDFATIVSHDLKAPLRAVATLATWIRSDYEEKLDAEGKEHLAEIVKRVTRMDAMINGILEYARIGRAQREWRSIDTRQLLDAVLLDLDVPPEVQVDVVDELPVVPGDPVRLKQVFHNLIDNAMKYADKPVVEIRIGAVDLGDFWEFRVSDNGPGIDRRHFDRVFRMFQTLPGKSGSESTGIGLALVKRIVESAGGTISVDSQLGVGSTFAFTWPKLAPRMQGAMDGDWTEEQAAGDRRTVVAAGSDLS